MGDLSERYRTWVVERAGELKESVEGLELSRPDADHVVIETPSARGQVNFYDVGGEAEIVEMRIAPPGDEDACTFFIHFELLDEQRAHDTFEEMLEVLVDTTRKRTTRVLLTCTSALTTTYFANKLAEAAAVLSLDFEFFALSIDEAIAHASEYDAVMVAPQAAYRVDELRRRNPDTLVFETPAKVFGSYDAGTALKMLLSAMSEDAMAERIEESDTKIVRELGGDARVLVLSIIGGTGMSTMRYRVYDRGEVVLDDRNVRQGNVDLARLPGDVRATLGVAGIDYGSLDAIGIAVSGVVDNGVVSTWSAPGVSEMREVVGDNPLADIARTLRGVGRAFGRDAIRELDLRQLVEDQLGVPTFVEKSTNAAAVGSYVSQTDYDSVVLYRQPTGIAVASQGAVLDGRLVRGKGGSAGELGCLVRSVSDAAKAMSLTWTSPGMLDLVYGRLLEIIVAYGPDVIYTSVDLLPDMAELAERLGSMLPERFVPALVPVTDFYERILVGQYALTLHGLKDRRRRARA